MIFHHMLSAVAYAIEEPHLTGETARSESIQHAEHGSKADTTADQDNRRPTGHIQEKFSTGRFDIKDIAFFEVVMEKRRPFPRE